ncbi:MAG: hypothetical protein JO040_05500 [Gemmatimonadetes bacterium]|nr:hypothetical protein [Gemmatimonadota bacterium]
MPRRREIPSTERIRQTAELRVRETSLRQVAYRVGVSPMGLKKFLDGASPYENNRRKLVDWFLREESQPREPVRESTVAAIALGMVLRDLPTPLRTEAVDTQVQLLESLYSRSQAPRPAWLEGLREQLAEELESS